MDYVTIIAVVLAFIVGAGIYYIASTKYEKKMEATVKKAAEYMVTYKDALVAQFGQETYDEMKQLIDDANNALSDGSISVQETIKLIGDAYPVAKKIVAFIAKKV